MEERIDPGRVGGKLGQLLRCGAKRVIATASDAAFHVQHLLLVVEEELLLQQGGLVFAIGLLGDRHQRLARHIAAQYQHIHFVEFSSVEELFPADFGAVHIGGEEQARHRQPF